MLAARHRSVISWADVVVALPDERHSAATVLLVNKKTVVVTIRGALRRRRANRCAGEAHPGFGDAGSRRSRFGAAPRYRAEGGYTLIELIVVLAVIPIILGAIAAGLIAVFSLQTSAVQRTSDSADAQIVATNFEKDVQSAVMLTTDAGVTVPATQCGSGTQLLGLEWGLNQQTGAYESVVSYVKMPQGTRYELVRQYCASGASSTPTSASTVSYDIPANQPPPTIVSTGTTNNNAAAQVGWVATQGITAVTLAITEPASNYTYKLVGLPGSSSSSSQQSTVATPSTSCGFATPGTGTYSSTLCFVDFTPWNSATKSSGTTCPAGTLWMSAAIAGTPYTLSFCLTTSGGPVAAAPTPTYYSPTWSEAYLGNNGFYTGIPGNPAIYQTQSGTTTTVTITKIAVNDANGSAATGWELVTGDAETTDPGESLTFTSDQNLSLLPDTLGGGQASAIGNACGYTPSPPGTLYPGTWLTGVGTTSVECAASVPSIKTGTVMLEAPSPTSLTVKMVGSGLEAIFVGVLLP